MMAYEVKRECSLVLVGKTGMGKSSLGNSLLCHSGPGEKPFKSKKSAGSITKQCERKRATLGDGTLLTIVDTPGLFDTSVPNGQTINEIIKCISLSTPGPHAILFVLNLRRFTEEEIKTVDILKRLFGTEAMKYIVVVFTGKDELDDVEDDDDIKTIQDFVKNGPDYLRKFVRECNMRYVGIANKPSSPTHCSDVKDVMTLIYKTMEVNGDQVYSQEAFSQSERIIKEEIERRKQTSQKSENEIREDILNGIESNDASILYIVGNGLIGCISHALSIPVTLGRTAINMLKPKAK